MDRNPDEQGAAAARGTLLHACIAAELRGWEMPDIGRYQLKYDMTALRGYLGEGDLMCELAMSYDGRGTKLVGENVGRDAYPQDGSLCGSADIFLLREHALLADIKTGQIDAPAPEENEQLQTLAMMAEMLFRGGVKSVTGVIAKLLRDGSWVFSSHVYTLEHLRKVRDRIDAARALWLQADEIQQSGWGVEPVPGPHCRFCRSKCQHADAKVYPAAAVANAV
jgi:hypothetical protein